jgi:hypothetical protein
VTTTPRLAAALTCLLASLTSALASPPFVSAAGATVRPTGGLQAGEQTAVDQASAPVAAATVEQCVTSVIQGERSATFSAEMTAIPRSARMAMRIDIQERMPGEALFHTISAPGLGVWRESDAGVKNYKYIKQVTNLSAPAFYRAAVSFRWLSAQDHTIRHGERHTPSCAQPATSPAPQ